MQNKNNNKAGYTIIETMIAISLFIVIVIAGMGALLNANLLRQKSQSMRSILDNLSFIMEDMSRNLRTGYNYHCITTSDFSSLITPSSCSNANGKGIAFEYQNGDVNNPNDQWVYFIDNNGKIWKSTQGPYTNWPTNYTQLTPDEVQIDPASFFSVFGAEPGDGKQPFVTIKLVGNITFKNVVTPFTLQTSVSQRKLDI